MASLECGILEKMKLFLQNSYQNPSSKTGLGYMTLNQTIIESFVVI